MRILCISYREWALEIYDQLAKATNHTFLILRSKEQYSEEIFSIFKPELVLFYGWSWLIPASIYDTYECLMLHPSPLPKYRGGSPLQNQIINGEVSSQVTIFRINQTLDGGDIYAQGPLSLRGSLDEIFQRIISEGVRLTKVILAGNICHKVQNEKEATSCIRRTPEQSEISLEELRDKSAEYLFNKVRMLSNPYPNAYIRTKDGKKLLIKVVEIDNFDENLISRDR